MGKIYHQNLVFISYILWILLIICDYMFYFIIIYFVIPLFIYIYIHSLSIYVYVFDMPYTYFLPFCDGKATASYLHCFSEV